jgi:hypothetical protein
MMAGLLEMLGALNDIFWRSYYLAGFLVGDFFLSSFFISHGGILPLGLVDLPDVLHEDIFIAIPFE